MLYAYLMKARQYGARGGRLVAHVPELIELLFSSVEYPDLDLDKRAALAEALIRAAIEAIGGGPGRALAILFCIAPGTSGLKIGDRRHMAATFYRATINAETFRHLPYEGALVRDLAFEIYRLHPASQIADFRLAG